MTYENMKDSGVPWIGRMPSHWKCVDLKYLFEIKKEIVGELGFTVLSITQQGIKPKNMSDKGQFALDYSKYQRVNPGDFAMNHMDLLTGWVDISKYSGVTSPDYRVFRSRKSDSIYPDYFKYIFQIGYMCRIFYGLGQGVAGFGRWRLPSDMFLNFPLPVPPLKEQSRIALALDKFCNTINSLIQEAQSSIDECKRWKASVIYQTVTKGLNPNVEMRDSGIPWIGKVPVYWDIIPLKYLCFMQAGKNLTSEKIALTGDYPVYGGNGLRGFYTDFNTDGDFLLVGRQGALCGNVHKVSGKFWATEHAIITTPARKIHLSFLYYLLIGMNLNQYASNAAAQPGLSVSAILNVRTTFPPMEEQQKIASYLAEKVSNIDTIIFKKQSLITELEAYKKSLIYEAVTGKRKVE